jgi:hypothetical protein
MMTPAKKTSPARKKPATPAPEITKASEIPTCGSTRQEVAPIAVELFKLCHNEKIAAKKAVDLLRACDRAIEADSTTQWIKSRLHTMESKKFDVSCMTEKQIQALTPEEQWQLGKEVKFADMVKIATHETERKDRAKKKFLDYVESIVGSSKEWDTAKAGQVAKSFDELWKQCVKNPNPHTEGDLLHDLLIVFSHSALPAGLRKIFQKFFLL